MIMITWLSENIVEVFGAVTGIAYVILEIRRNILLWPLGILTSAVYIYVFGRNGFYAGMVLQGYYVVISIYGWYAWSKLTHGVRQSREPGEQGARSQEHGALGKEQVDDSPDSEEEITRSVRNGGSEAQKTGCRIKRYR
jgi:nicotinamide riboside transporter PnuC